MLPEDSSPRVIVVKPEMPAPTPVRPNGAKAPPAGPSYDPAFVCLLELATIFATRDDNTMVALGKDVAEALQSAIRDADRLHPVAVSRLSYYLLTLLRSSSVSNSFHQATNTQASDNSQDHDYLRAPLVLHSISSFPQDLLKQCAQNVLKGVLDCVKGPQGLRNELATSPDFWSLLHTLRASPEAASLAFQIIDNVATGPNAAITADNYEPAISLLNAFAAAGSASVVRDQKREQQARRGRPQQAIPEKKPARSDTIIRGVKAITIVQQLANRVPDLIEQSHLESNEAWLAYWQPIFRCLNTQCINPCREIRQQALASLQRCLLASDLASSDHKEWTNIFSGVLFPLLNQLLRPEVYQSDPMGMSETRIQTAQLLCKIFLHYLVLLNEWEGMLDLWKEILIIMERLMRSGGGDSLVWQTTSSRMYDYSLTHE